jgi:hypothetical protein
MTAKRPYFVVFDYLTANPERTAKQIATAVSFDTSTVNAILYRSPRVFVSTADKAPKWSARSIARRKVTNLVGEK